MQKQHGGGKRGPKPRDGSRRKGEAPKVWHNPDVVVGPRTSASRATSEARPRVVVAEGDAKRGRGRRGASDAAPPQPATPAERAPSAPAAPSSGTAIPASGRPHADPPPSKPATSSPPGSAGPRSARIVAAAQPPTDPKVLERERLLSRLVTAEGRPAITRAADAFVAAGFDLPDDQTVQLQMLEHSREAYVQTAVEKLAAILAGEPCKRFTVLESRLRRLEEFADEPDLRESARDLRRKVRARHIVAEPPASEPGRTPRPAPVVVDDDA